MRDACRSATAPPHIISLARGTPAAKSEPALRAAPLSLRPTAGSENLALACPLGRRLSSRSVGRTTIASITVLLMNKPSNPRNYILRWGVSMATIILGCAVIFMVLACILFLIIIALGLELTSMQTISRMKVAILMILLLSMVGCNTEAPEASMSPTPTREEQLPVDIQNVRTIGDPFKEQRLETLRTENCDGYSTHTSVERSLAREETTTFEVSAGAGALVKGSPIPGFLEAQLEAQIQSALSRSLNLSYQQQIVVNIETPTGTATEHTIIWREIKVDGAVDVVYSDAVAEIWFQKIIGIELYGRDSTPLPCENQLTATATQESSPVVPTLTATPQPATREATVLPTQTPIIVPATSTVQPSPTIIPRNPTPTLAIPMIFNSDDRVPVSGQTRLEVSVNRGEAHVVTSGPICIAGTGICLPGGEYGQRRGSVVVLLPREDPYILTGLVPENNWHGSYYAQPEYAQTLAEQMADEMMEKSPSNINCDGGCNIIDILILGSDGIIASYTAQS